MSNIFFIFELKLSYCSVVVTCLLVGTSTDVFLSLVDLVNDTRPSLCTRCAMLRGFSGGKQEKKSVNTRMQSSLF